MYEIFSCERKKKKFFNFRSRNETISVEKLRQRFDSDRRENEEKIRKASNPRPPIKAKPILSSFSSAEVKKVYVFL